MKKRAKVKTIKLTVFFFVIAFLYILFFVYKEGYSNKKTLPNENISKKESLDLKVTPTPETSKSLPDFSTNPSIPRNKFDLSNWKTYENKEIGFRLKYPAEWGEPEAELRKLKYDDNSSSDGCKGKNGCILFDLTFCAPTSTPFKLSCHHLANSRTKYFYPGGPDSLEGHYWNDYKRDFCSLTANEAKAYEAKIIHCQTVGNITDATLYDSFFGSVSYRRVRLIKLKNKLLPGLTFGGDFGLDEYLNLNYPTLGMQDIDSPDFQNINKALLDRKLPSEIMYNFDLLEKIFETIEII